MNDLCVCLVSCVQMQRSALWWKAVLLGTAKTARPCRKQTVEPMIQAAWRQSPPTNTERADHQRAPGRRRQQGESLKSHRASDSRGASKRAKIHQWASHLQSHTHRKVCWKWQVRKMHAFHLTGVTFVAVTCSYTYIWSIKAIKDETFWLSLNLQQVYNNRDILYTHIHTCSIVAFLLHIKAFFSWLDYWDRVSSAWSRVCISANIQTGKRHGLSVLFYHIFIAQILSKS